MRARQDIVDENLEITNAPLTDSLRPSKTDLAALCLTDLNLDFIHSQSSAWTVETTAFNLRVPSVPSLLVFAESAQQVSDVVSCAASSGLNITARGGGHSYASLGLGGESDHLVIDLTRMNNITVNQNTYVATIQAGARLGDVASELFKQGGRAISHGSCPAVGISGHALHGGYGWASHNRGLALDWIAGAHVVLANGTHVHCSATEHDDLFWAIRGAGSNFGIVTSYEFYTFAAPRTSIPFSVTLSWTTEQQKTDGIRALVEFAKDMPTEINMRLNAHNGGRHTFEGVSYGDEDELRNILAPLLEQTGGDVTAKPGTWVQGLEYFAENNSLTVPLPYHEHGNFYATSLTLKELRGQSLVNFAHYWATAASNETGWFFQLDLHGGENSAVTQVPNSATAYAHRDKAFLIQFYRYAPDSAPFPEEGIEFLRNWVNTTSEPLEDGNWGMYINYVDSQLDRDTATKLYYGENLAKLQQIKAKYDPDDVFRYPQSIQPIA